MWGGGAPLQWGAQLRPCSRLMSGSNSEQPAALSNCINDAPLSRFTCPILQSHGLAMEGVLRERNQTNMENICY